jgi:hypothetical protein
MSNLAAHPDESSLLGDVCLQPELHLVPAREVPLGGIRAITVRRTLPDRTLPVVGPWCFLDAFDSEVDAMTVLPHPHTGLQTVTWPLDGEIRHRDSLGSDLVLRPGQLNRTPNSACPRLGGCEACNSGWRSPARPPTGQPTSTTTTPSRP